MTETLVRISKVNPRSQVTFAYAKELPDESNINLVIFHNENILGDVSRQDLKSGDVISISGRKQQSKNGGHINNEIVVKKMSSPEEPVDEPEIAPKPISPEPTTNVFEIMSERKERDLKTMMDLLDNEMGEECTWNVLRYETSPRGTAALLVDSGGQYAIASLRTHRLQPDGAWLISEDEYIELEEAYR